MAFIKFPKINLTVQLILIIGLVSIGHTYLSSELQSIFYAISLTIKEVLVFILPFIIFCCIYACMMSFKNRALIFMLIVMGGVCLSNFITAWIGYGISTVSLHHISLNEINTVSFNGALTPYWHWLAPKWFANEHALLSGLIVGALFTFFPNKMASKFAEQANRFVHLILNQFFVPLLPLFALGFIIKMAHDGFLSNLMHHYIWVVAIIFASYAFYISFLYALCAKFNLKRWNFFIKNVFPAGIMGFSSMSSLAAMPINIHAAELNTAQPIAARAIIPATANIHLIGDSLFIPILAIALLISHGAGIPTLHTFFIFSLFFVISKFAVAGVPGGGIIVMIPVLEKYLGFSSEMSALMTSIYILFDPFNTCANVIGNGAFAILITRLFKSTPFNKFQK